MSTRANIKLTDNYDDVLWFYRHSDGYPSSTLPSLQIFVGWLNDGSIRGNVGQGGGWLIMAGAREYGTVRNYEAGKVTETEKIDITIPIEGWKVGAYEPTTDQHGDIEYLYTIDMDKKTITIESLNDGATNIIPFDKFLNMISKDFRKIEKAVA